MVSGDVKVLNRTRVLGLTACVKTVMPICDYPLAT